MLERTVFEAKDGKLFANKGDCEIYERALSVNSAVVIIRNFCNKLQCTECPFYIMDSEIFKEKRCMFKDCPRRWETV